MVRLHPAEEARGSGRGGGHLGAECTSDSSGESLWGRRRDCRRGLAGVNRQVPAGRLVQPHHEILRVTMQRRLAAVAPGPLLLLLLLLLLGVRRDLRVGCALSLSASVDRRREIIV